MDLLPTEWKNKVLVALMNYMSAVQQNPLRTKALTAAVCNLTSNITGQAICIAQATSKNRYLEAKRKEAEQEKILSQEQMKQFQSVPVPKFDVVRAVKFGFFGLIVSGPFFHFWYQILPKLVERLSSSYKLTAQIALDRLVATPVFFLLFYTWNAITTKPMPEWVETVQKEADSKLATTVARSLFLWIPAQYYNFTSVPIQFRVLYGNLISLLWNIYFSITN
eukprot:TRINITY_DN3461_c0_g1_i1.p1 TRINITY_DN3461_c0_g1~~TRINITY_DN3461_c0_g1_i1.p1  ORF type:complete len:229 (+),score=50.30 TRINITY_DN3461_c0_g1_i1:23-688(+)